MSSDRMQFHLGAIADKEKKKLCRLEKSAKNAIVWLRTLVIYEIHVVANHGIIVLNLQIPCGIRTQKMNVLVKPISELVAPPACIAYRVVFLIGGGTAINAMRIYSDNEGQAI
ncbi:hypothetical protein [Methylobacterium sp. CM6247]